MIRATCPGESRQCPGRRNSVHRTHKRWSEPCHRPREPTVAQHGSRWCDQWRSQRRRRVRELRHVQPEPQQLQPRPPTGGGREPAQRRRRWRGLRRPSLKQSRCPECQLASGAILWFALVLCQLLYCVHACFGFSVSGATLQSGISSTVYWSVYRPVEILVES